VWSGVLDIEIDYKKNDGLLIDPLNEVSESYFKKIKNLSHGNDKSKLKIVYTAMHGVGEKFVKRAFKDFGLPGILKILIKNLLL
jgi:phosphomannomutase